MVHLHSFEHLSLVATPSASPFPSPLPARPARTPGKRPRRGRSQTAALGEGSLQLIQGSLSGRRVERQAPLLASLHKVSTGVLVGLGFSLVGLSALTLHWQNQWAKNYAQLEAAKVLEHRLHESAAVLEQHHIRAMRRPGQLLPTSSENLIHLPEPKETGSLKPSIPLLAGLAIGRSPSGQALPPLPAGY
ncbi:MAG: hypothetical protein RLZZ609_256 [Cyanobacteriota bacterium]